jgi:hypothetical protein
MNLRAPFQIPATLEPQPHPSEGFSQQVHQCGFQAAYCYTSPSGSCKQASFPKKAPLSIHICFDMYSKITLSMHVNEGKC